MIDISIAILAVAMILAGLNMARRGRRRRRYRAYIAGKLDHKLQLGTLGAQVVVGSLIGSTVVDTTWVSSVKATYTMNDFTAATDDGPILVGWAHSDYTDAEIEAWIESTSSWDIGNKIAQEVSNRKCKQVGTFFRSPSSATEWIALNEGRMTTTKLGWMLSPSQTLRFWAYNTGSSALATTDPEVRVQGHANLWPK